MRWLLFLSIIALLVGAAAAPPGGVVVEGSLAGMPSPGTSTPFTIRISKGGLEYFGRILIALPDDCRLEARQLHGGGLTFNEERHVAVISWLKLPEAEQFDITLDLKVSPLAAPGARSMEWDFSFIRNNDRVTVRPNPFHFEVLPEPEDQSGIATTPMGQEFQDGSAAGVAQEAAPHSVTACRTITPIGEGHFEVRINISGLPAGGFVKLEERLPALCEVDIKSGGGGVSEVDLPDLSFIWFDYQHTGSVLYQVKYCRLSDAEDISGLLSYVDGDQPASIPVLSCTGQGLAGVESPESPGLFDDVSFEVQVAATNHKVVTDYFKRRLNFSPPVSEEFEGGRFKYLNGSFESYEEARNHRESLESYDFIGPFVVARRLGQRIPVQEALTRTGQRWIP